MLSHLPTTKLWNKGEWFRRLVFLNYFGRHFGSHFLRLSSHETPDELGQGVHLPLQAVQLAMKDAVGPGEGEPAPGDAEAATW
jgi:hypothetical protein